MSPISLKGRKCRACIFANHSLIKEKAYGLKNVVSRKCYPFPELNMVSLKFPVLETGKFDILYTSRNEEVLAYKVLFGLGGFLNKEIVQRNEQQLQKKLGHKVVCQ